ncbi:MAG TPA: hypothetical protein VK750_01525 [Cytophagaceae bacterium]|jgi:hypothetical protein|nr:hypothetical protein [Cytophagaceae bacterium]
MQRIVILMIGLLLVLNAQGQTKKKVTGKTTLPTKTTSSAKVEKDSTALKNTLKILSSVNEKSVKLRWALTSSTGWKACNEYGFRIERYTLKKDSTWLPTPELMVMANPYKAKPLSEWETLAKQDDYAAIMAQALYGQEMKVDISDHNPLTQIVNQTQDLQQRYALSMLACDMSFNAAKFAGWGYEDSTVKKNERYFYRVIPLAPATKILVDSAYVVVKMEEVKKLPAPGKPDIIFGDSTATVGYNYFFLKDTYMAFHIERSEDNGKSFQQLTKTPVTAMNVKQGQDSYQFFYSDKLKDNTTTYHYRIKGVTSFSEIGPVSPIVKGKGITHVSAFPHLTSCLLNEKDYAELEWEFDASNEKKIKGFEISHSTKNGGPYKVVESGIVPTVRKFTVKKLESSNYFSITAIGKNGERNTSPVRFLQLIDSIPPAPPEILSATVDSLGKVIVIWKANTEKDMLGYKLFRKNNLKEEAYPLNDTLIKATVMEDQLHPSMINRKIYYSVMAFDKRYNQSTLVKFTEVVRPDVTPPTSPLFKTYKITEDGVYLNWARCQEEDVDRHILLRKSTSPKATWVIVAQFKDTTSFYTDRTAEAGRSYWYSILAKDESGLESVPVQPLKLSLPADPVKLKVTGFKAVPNLEGTAVELQWQTDRNDIDHFDLYKAEEEEPITLWKIQDGKVRNTKDSIKLNYRYEYMIRMVLKNGSTGAFSKINF